jgi:hypothetical protein
MLKVPTQTTKLFMKKLNYPAVFVKLCNEINRLHPDDLRNLLGLRRFYQSRMRAPIEAYLFLLLEFRLSQTKSFLHFFEAHRARIEGLLTEQFQYSVRFPTYATSIRWCVRVGPFFEHFLKLSCKKLTNKQLCFIDSTVLETSKLYCWGKVHKEASIAHSSTGKYFGFKLHLLVDASQQVCSFHLSSGKTHDLDPIKYHQFLKGHSATIYADSGYLSQSLYYQLMTQNIELLAKPKPNMGAASDYSFKRVVHWDLKHKKVYRKRFCIERIFHYLKVHLNLSLNATHSSKSAQAHVYSCLWLYQMMQTDKSLLL